jgi:hypothetical protein
MYEYNFRKANLSDIPFLVNTIIEAEKSGTDILSYSTIFGLTEEESRKYIADMLLENVDGCELSISSYLVAEKNNKAVAAISAWIEGLEGVPGLILKGNMLSFILPRKCIERAMQLNAIIRDLNIDTLPDTIQIGVGYVSKENRGNNLLGLLVDEKIKLLSEIRPDISEIYAQIFNCNTPALKTFEKLNFKKVMMKESSREDITQYLPSNKKFLMKKEL